MLGEAMGIATASGYKRYRFLMAIIIALALITLDFIRMIVFLPPMGKPMKSQVGEPFFTNP